MADIFDHTHFDHMTGGDVALQQEIIGLFRGQIAEWHAALNAAAPSSDWRDAAHKLKGSARGIGLHALAEACEHAEAAPEAEIRARLTALRAELDAALLALA